MKAHGYEYLKTVMAQDNKSAIILEQNGIVSGSKRTKHINVRYFFRKYRIGKGKLEVEYCLTDKMLAYCFVKPLQGVEFIKSRNQIINLED